MVFPEKTIQALCGGDHWWKEETAPKVVRGSIVWTLVPFHTGMHVRLVVQRKENAPGEHGAAQIIKAERYTLSSDDVDQALPIAMLPKAHDGHYTLRLVKKRPALVLALPGDDIPSHLVRGKPESRTVPCLLVAPYYTAIKPGEEPKYSPELLELVQKLRFPQFFYEHLPFPGGNPSILRFDQVQAVPAKERDFYLASKWRLADHALALIDEILEWQIWGGIPEDSSLASTALPFLNGID